MLFFTVLPHLMVGGCRERMPKLEPLLLGMDLHPSHHPASESLASPTMPQAPPQLLIKSIQSED